MILDSIALWFTEAVPTPTEKNRVVQLGCHLEEVSEMLVAIEEYSLAAKVGRVAALYKASTVMYGAVDRTELLDSLADQIVTAVGVAHMFGMDIRGALDEVDRSNWTKFVDGKPVFDANGKIAKPPTYSAPDLGAFI